jgi:hypothetical protein
MRARFAFPMQCTGRDIAAAPESMPSRDGPAPRGRATARAIARARERARDGGGSRAGPVARGGSAGAARRAAA